MRDLDNYPNPVESARILLVEDSRLELYRLEALLKGFQFDTISCSQPSDALQILLAEHIDIVLCDWRMPDMSGLELCKTINRSPAMGDPYFIMLTGRRERSDVIAAIDAGADDFISKPAAGEELRARLQAGLRRLERERVLLERRRRLVNYVQ